MTPAKLLWRGWFGAFAMGCIASLAMAQSSSVQPPWQQQAIAGAFSPKRSFTQVDRGYLVSFRRVITGGPAEDTIHWDSLTAQGHGEFPFWIKGASGIWLNDVKVTPDGDFLVAGVWGQSGKSSVNNFLSLVDRTGAVLKTKDLGSYEAERVCASNDGNVWTLGEDDGINYNMLRKYSSAGEVLASYLNRASLLSVAVFDLSAHNHFVSKPRPQSSPPGRTFLRCGDEGVGVYIGPVRTWFQVPLVGGGAQSWHVNPPVGSTVMTGILLMGSNEVYASFSAGWARGKTTKPHAPQYGLYLLDLSGQTPVWDPVPGTVSPSGRPFERLLGGDGSGFVYMGVGDTSKDGTMLLSWIAR
jgi:hypothetical protein